MKIGIIGCGHMVQALFGQMKEVLAGQQITTYTPTYQRAQELAASLGGVAQRDLAFLPHCEVVVLGMKPQQLPAFEQAVAGMELGDPVVISLLAATPVARLQQVFPQAQRLIRLMPNTPTAIGAGVSLFYSNWPASQEFEAWFQAAGQVVALPREELIDALTPHTGSFPALLIAFVEVFCRDLAARAPELAVEPLMRQVLVGCAQLIASSPLSLAELREQVTSRKGVTEAILASFEEQGLEALIQRSLRAKPAFQRPFRPD